MMQWYYSLSSVSFALSVSVFKSTINQISYCISKVTLVQDRNRKSGVLLVFSGINYKPNSFFIREVTDWNRYAKAQLNDSRITLFNVIQQQGEQNGSHVVSRFIQLSTLVDIACFLQFYVTRDCTWSLLNTFTKTSVCYALFAVALTVKFATWKVPWTFYSIKQKEELFEKLRFTNSSDEV